MLRPGSTKLITGIVLLGLLVLSNRVVLAEEYPTKPVTLIVPSDPGGATDILMRAITSVAVDYLGQPVLIKLSSLQMRDRNGQVPCSDESEPEQTRLSAQGAEEEAYSAVNIA